MESSTVNADIEEIINRLGKPIGLVSIADIVKVGSEDYNVIIDIPYENYINSQVRIGDYVGIYTFKNPEEPHHNAYVILGRVTEIRRTHAVGTIGVRPIYGIPRDYSGLRTPATIIIEPLTECPAPKSVEDWACDPTPVYTPIEPLSIAFKPHGNVITKLLALPREGVLLGHLYSGGQEIMDVEVRIPEYVLYEHMLLVGTTGSGKTTLLKNLALAVMGQVRDATVVALDLQGDYLHVTLPPDREPTPKALEPLNEITVIKPITIKYLKRKENDLFNYANQRLQEIYRRSDATIYDIVKEPNSIKRVKDAFAYALLRDFVNTSYGDQAKITEIEGSGRFYCDEAEVMSQGQGQNQENRISIRLGCIRANVEVSGRSFTLTLIPWALRFSEVYDDLPRLFPGLTTSPRVMIVFGPLIEEVMRHCSQSNQYQMRRSDQTRRSSCNEIHALISNSNIIEEVARRFRLHGQQVDSIIRGLATISSIGIVDVALTFISANISYEVSFGEPNYSNVFRGFVDIDLRTFRENPTAATIVVYRLLDKILEIRDREAQPKPTFILIDEAHNYFPQSSRGEDINKEAVESMINRLTRLGRVRRIGVVFATHTPSDLNELVLQLTNTKIALRSEGAVLEKVGLKDYTHELAYAQDGVAVIRSYALRTHTLTIKALPPQVKHRSHK